MFLLFSKAAMRALFVMCTFSTLRAQQAVSHYPDASYSGNEMREKLFLVFASISRTSVPFEKMRMQFISKKLLRVSPQ
jgi:hypothetical protein